MKLMESVYITGIGKFLPGPVVPNDEMEAHIGRIHGVPSRVRQAILRRNGIKGRHYAIDAEGRHFGTNAGMAAEAIRAACGNAHRGVGDLQYLATSTTQGDLLVPGFGSTVHAELGTGPMEVASFQSVCASSMMAIRAAYLNLRAGDHHLAAVSGSEFSSRWFQPGFYEAFVPRETAAEPPADLEFLRWTLSDGAGALVLETAPRSGGTNLRIDWIDIRSFAGEYENCMFAGQAGNKGAASLPWSHYPSPGAAYEAGSLALRQDFKLLHRMFTTWAGFYLATIEARGVDPAGIDHFLPHYSAESLGAEMRRLLSETGAMIPEERWFTTLRETGNVGSASIFLMLDGLAARRDLAMGQTILCFVPESGRCLAGFMHLTVI